MVSLVFIDFIRALCCSRNNNMLQVLTCKCAPNCCFFHLICEKPYCCASCCSNMLWGASECWIYRRRNWDCSCFGNGLYSIQKCLLEGRAYTIVALDLKLMVGMSITQCVDSVLVLLFCIWLRFRYITKQYSYACTMSVIPE